MPDHRVFPHPIALVVTSRGRPRSTPRLSGTARTRSPNEDPFYTTSLGDSGQRDAMGNSVVATRARRPWNTVIHDTERRADFERFVV